MIHNSDASEIGRVQHRLSLTKRVNAKHDTSKRTPDWGRDGEILGAASATVFYLSLAEFQSVSTVLAAHNQLEWPLSETCSHLLRGVLRWQGWMYGLQQYVSKV